MGRPGDYFVTKGKHVRFRKVRPATLRIVVVALCAVLLAPMIIRRVHFWTIRTAPALAGPLEDVHNLRAVVVRDEVLVSSPAAGRFVPAVVEGQRVRRGEQLGLLLTDADQTIVRAPRPGIARFHWDGREMEMTAPVLWELTPEQWRTMSVQAGRTPEYAEPGTTLMRLVDSHGVRLYADVPRKLNLQSGQKVTLNIPDATDETLQATVVDSREIGQDERVSVLFGVDRYLPLLDAVRHIDVRLVAGRYEGVIIPADAVVWTDEGAGVFVRSDGQIAFVPVRLSTRIGDKAVVTDLEPGADVVINPWRVGMR